MGEGVTVVIRMSALCSRSTPSSTVSVKWPVNTEVGEDCVPDVRRGIFFQDQSCCSDLGKSMTASSSAPPTGTSEAVRGKQTRSFQQPAGHI